MEDVLDVRPSAFFLLVGCLVLICDPTAAEAPPVIEPGGTGDAELVNVESNGGEETDAAIIAPGGEDPLGALEDAPPSHCDRSWGNDRRDI